MAVNEGSYLSKEFMEYFNHFSSDYRTRTVKEYLGIVRLLSEYAKKDFLDISPTDAGNFFSDMKIRIQHDKMTVSTYNARLSCCKKLGTYIEETYPQLNYSSPFVLIEALPMKLSIKASNVPSLEEMDALLSVSKDNSMYYLILCLAFRMGLSSSDIVALRRTYIRQLDDCVTIVFPPDPSHKEQREKALPEDLKDIMLDYLKNMVYEDSEGHLFYNKYRNPLTLRNLDSLIKKMMKLSGVVGDYTIKDFRTRAILEMVRVSANDESGEELERVCEYVDIGELRMSYYKEARNLVNSCPANLVNLRVK